MYVLPSVAVNYVPEEMDSNTCDPCCFAQNGSCKEANNLQIFKNNNSFTNMRNATLKSTKTPKKGSNHYITTHQSNKIKEIQIISQLESITSQDKLNT